MSKLMRDILASKVAARRRLAQLPIEQKLTLMEKMRDRGLLISENSLRVQQQGGGRDVGQVRRQLRLIKPKTHLINGVSS